MFLYNKTKHFYSFLTMFEKLLHVLEKQLIVYSTIYSKYYNFQIPWRHKKCIAVSCLIRHYSNNKNEYQITVTRNTFVLLKFILEHKINRHLSFMFFLHIFISCSVNLYLITSTKIKIFIFYTLSESEIE